MRRYHITLGAKTSAGGVVIAATSMCSIEGVRVALEGDTVNCPACRSEGQILCDGPRLSERWNGKQVALHDDLCVCKCTPPPRLIAIQTHKSQWLAAEEDAVATPEELARLAEARVPRSAVTEEKIPIRFVDEATQEPHQNRPYRLELTDRVLEGVTDNDGLTEPLSAAERAALVTWHINAAPVP